MTNFDVVVFWKGKDCNEFVPIPNWSWSGKVSEVISKVPIILESHGTLINANTDFKAFWFGNNDWINLEDSEFTIHNQDKLLVLVDVELNDVSINAIQEIIKNSPVTQSLSEKQKGKLSSKIFLVYGHDIKSFNMLVNLLNESKYNVKYFNNSQIKGAETIIEILEKAIKDSDVIISLLTPDDIGKKNDSNEDFKPRARENVLIETGYAVVARRDRCIIIALGDVNIPSDFSGIHVIRGEKIEDTYQELLNRLRYLGLYSPQKVL